MAKPILVVKIPFDENQPEVLESLIDDLVKSLGKEYHLIGLNVESYKNFDLSILHPGPNVDTQKQLDEINELAKFIYDEGQTS